ncbi:ABC transporter ATP-binding protein [Pelagibacteraceae bacterium]|jgi:ABC-type lipoprotein export system ATPase subunit|nr:ABC transporter ATP-binding protein [Pelagibacteraceae bacterium]
MNNFLEIKNLSKVYNDKGEQITIFENTNFKLESNQLVTLTGPSGSGKSTLIHILCLLDSPNNGSFFLKQSEDLFKKNENEKSTFRKNNISIVFQSFNLISDLTAIENVMLPSLYSGKDNNETETDALRLLRKMNLENRINHLPKELSGGEQQRVAIARSMINNPELILADEPTGSLDIKNAGYVFDLMKEIIDENNLVIFATHNRSLVSKSNLELTISNRTVNF